MESADAATIADENLKMRVEIHFPGAEVKQFTFPQYYTVDKVKTEIFRNMSMLNESMKFDYHLGLDEETAIKVEFSKLVKCHPSIEAQAAADEVISLYLIARASASSSPDTSKKQLFRSRFLFGGRTEEVPSVAVSPRKASISDGTSLVAKRASAFSAVPNEECLSPGRGRPKAAMLSPTSVRSALNQSDLEEEGDDSKDKDGRIQRTNSFGERISQIKSLKQMTASAGAIPLEDSKKHSLNNKSMNAPEAVRRSGGDGTGTPKKGHRRTRSTGFIVSEILKRATTDDVGRAGMATQAMIPPSLVVEEESEESGLFSRKQSKRSSTVSARVRAAHQIFRATTQPTLGRPEDREPFPPKRVPLTDEEEQVGNALVNVVEGYMIETGRRTVTPELAENTVYNPDLSYTWYVDYFKGKEHENYIGSDLEFGTVVVSIIHEQDEGHKNIRAIIRTKHCDVTSLIPKADFGTNTFKKTSVREIVRTACPALADKLPKVNYKLIKNPALHLELENFETKQVIKNYKIGVLYCKEGQSQEDEMFCNEYGSEAFEQFLDFLGDRVELNGWKKYRAGLDVNGGSTGTHSVHTQWNGGEIMFHVSTLLPFTPGDPQQIERKRHLGNDILMIVFKEGNGPPFSPNTITSEFNHVFAVITPTEIDGSDLRLSGGTTPRRLVADEDEESPRSNRFTAKGPAAAAAAENKSKAARMSRSPPRRRKQDNAISKDKGSRKSVMTRSPTKKDKEVAYRVAITRKDGVPLYGPHFEGDVFPRNQQFRDFLFYKLTNGERAAYDAPIFNRKMTRVRAELLKHLEKTFA